MKLPGAILILFFVSISNAFCITPSEKTEINSKEVITVIVNSDGQVITLNEAMLMGNPYSWWNRWGKKTVVFTGVFAAGIGAGFGLGSVVPGIGTVSGTIVGVAGGLLSAIAVVRSMKEAE